MRLGTKPTPFLVDDCKIRRLYGGEGHVDERHRHRYEVNPELIGDIEGAGLVYVGKDETGERCEIMELDGHPYYAGTQYHPEFKSRPDRPSPPFLGLLMAASGMKSNPQRQVEFELSCIPEAPSCISSRRISHPVPRLRLNPKFPHRE